MTSNLPHLTSSASDTHTDLMVSKANEINQLHQQAFTKAKEAIGSARKVGELLLEVKDSLKHGQFHKWIEEHCAFSLRQSQRYMNVALDKPVPIKELAVKSDMMSHLKPPSTKSEGLWKDGKWTPERGCVYLFNDEEGSAYWVTPSDHEIPHFHICKHYSGIPMSPKDFHWRYTVFGDNDQEDLTSEFYVGTRFPLFGASGVAEVLKSYGLKDIKGSLVLGKKTKNRFERPFGEPDAEHRYWEQEIADLMGGTPSQNPESATHPTGTPAS
jgi:Protein of unknown function (DUF3102)